MNKTLLPSLFLLAFATGCFGSAQVHYQDTQGGVLILKGAESKAMEHARSQMAAHCGPANFQITKQERVVVGREQYANSYGDYSEQKKGQKNTQASAYGSSSTDVGRTRNGAYVDKRGQAHADSQEQSRERTDGQSYQTSVAGERDVTEFRISYACGGGQAVGSR